MVLNQNVLFYFFTRKGIVIDNIILNSLEKVKELNNSYNLPDFIKPCVSLILDTSFSKGDTYSRNEYCYLVFTEFRRIGIKKDDAKTKIGIWNSLNNPPLPESDIRSCLNSAYKKNFTYGCNNQKLQEFCEMLGGKDSCFYYRKISKKNIKYSADCYIDYGWQKILTSRECYILFYIIPLIERNRGLSTGSWLYVSCREFAQVSGVNERYFSHNENNKHILDKLKAYGLIEYITGKKHIWYKTANRIKRIIPIPIPLKCKYDKY